MRQCRRAIMNRTTVSLSVSAIRFISLSRIFRAILNRTLRKIYKLCNIMEMIQIPPKVIDALENAIITGIEDRIENDPDVADTYLRIIAQDGKFTV